MATLAPASRTSSACFPFVMPPVAKMTFLFCEASGVVRDADEDGGGDADAEAESADAGGSWSIWVEEESAGEASESAVSEVEWLLRAGMRMKGWDLEDASASAMSGLRFAESRATVASILADISGICWAGGC